MCQGEGISTRTASSVVAVPVAAAWLPLGSASDVVDGTADEVAAGAEAEAGTAPKPAKENGALDGVATEVLAAAGAAVALGGARLRAARHRYNISSPMPCARL